MDMIDRQAAIEALDGEVTVTGRANAEAVRGYANLICDRIKRLPSAQPEQRWIPCSERLPEHGGFYIVTRVITEEDDKWVGLRWYSTGHGWEWDETPIAWMPLPEPYTEEEAT